MKFSGRCKGNTPVVIESIPKSAIKNDKRSIDQIVRDLSNEFGPDWKVWAGGVKDEPIMIGKEVRARS